MEDTTNAAPADVPRVPRKFTIAIEGNIAAGKSTLLARLESAGAQVVVEPVAEWQQIAEGEDGNLMARMYQDPKRWAYLFQSYVLLTMMEAHETEQTANLRVLERSVYSARHVFIENLRKSDPPLIDELEYTVYKRWFQRLMDQSRPEVDLIVYLRTSPTVCMDRLKQRGRFEEAGVPMEYLEALHTRYEEWLKPAAGAESVFDVPVLVVDGNTDASVYAPAVDDLCKLIATEVERLDAAKGGADAGDAGEALAVAATPKKQKEAPSKPDAGEAEGWGAGSPVAGSDEPDARGWTDAAKPKQLFSDAGVPAQ